MRRTELPARLTGTTGTDLVRWEDLFDLLDLHPELCAPIAASTLLTKNEGRPRRPGEWGWAYLAYVSSGHRELRRWHRQTSDALWERAGFAATPSYWSAYETFAALEAHAGAFETVATSLIAIAREASGGKVGFDVHVDGTEAETHSRLVHDCTGDELAECKRQQLIPRRAQAADARVDRHRTATDVPTEDELLGEATEIAADERGLRVTVGGCWYRLGDGEAGVRAYTRGDKVTRFWSGYYNLKAIDHYTGGVLAVHVCSASTQEHKAYPALYEQLIAHLGGETPRAVVADRGFSVSEVFELHTRDGVASVIPWRKSISEPTRADHEHFDRHGIPYCGGCGLETVFHRFVASNGSSGEPRLWYRCARPSTPGCQGVQSMLCKERWRSLLPLWRTTAAYQALRASHQNYEQTHHRWRERYAVAGDTRADRPKRIGLGVQQLRASAALVIEWLTICHRQGWLGGPVLNAQVERMIDKREADQLVRNIVSLRHRLGLTGVNLAHREEHVAQVATFDANHLDARRRGRATLLRRQRAEMDEAEGAVVRLQDRSRSGDEALDAP